MISNVRRYSKYTAAPNNSFFKFDGRFELNETNRYDFILVFGNSLVFLKDIPSPIAIKVNDSDEFDIVLEASQKYLQDTSRVFITGVLDPIEYTRRIQIFDGKIVFPDSIWGRSPVGIQNIGTTCWMNAFVQLMYTIYDTIFYFVEREYTGKKLNGFFQLLKDMKEGRLSSCRLIAGFSGYQDDPHILIDEILNDTGNFFSAFVSSRQREILLKIIRC